jgi:inner membrane protein
VSWPLARAVLLLGPLLALDVVRSVVELNLLADGVTDEPAHLLTALLILAAIRNATGVAPSRRVLVALLLGCVLIDLDHLPLYAGWSGVANDGRPFSHSLLTLLLLAGAAWLVPRAHRDVLLGAAVGVVLHLLRDLGTGPGVPLWWPLSTVDVRVPYAAYVGVVGIAAIVIALPGRLGRWDLSEQSREPSDPGRSVDG